VRRKTPRLVINAKRFPNRRPCHADTLVAGAFLILFIIFSQKSIARIRSTLLNRVRSRNGPQLRINARMFGHVTLNSILGQKFQRSVFGDTACPRETVLDRIYVTLASPAPFPFIGRRECHLKCIRFRVVSVKPFPIRCSLLKGRVTPDRARRLKRSVAPFSVPQIYE